MKNHFRRVLCALLALALCLPLNAMADVSITIIGEDGELIEDKSLTNNRIAHSFFRKLVYFAALFLIPVFGEARYAFWAEPVSDIIAPVVSIVVYRLTIHKVLDRRPAL